MKKIGLTFFILAGLTSLAGIAYAASGSNNNSQNTQQVQSSAQDNGYNTQADSNTTSSHTKAKNKKTFGSVGGAVVRRR